LSGNGEAVQVGKLDVEQDKVRLKAPDRAQRLLAGRCFTDDPDANLFEETPRLFAESGVIVNNHRVTCHGGIIALKACVWAQG
jgi:hypothetical protein